MVIARAKPVAIYDSEFDDADSLTSFAMTHFRFCPSSFFLSPRTFILYLRTLAEMTIRWASEVPS